MLECDGRLAPGTPFAAVLAGGADWKGALALWRAHQGRLRVDTLTLDWGQPKLLGHGEFALDSANRPLGVLALDFSGYRGLMPADQSAASAMRSSHSPRAPARTAER